MIRSLVRSVIHDARVTRVDSASPVSLRVICYAFLHDGQTIDHKPRVVKLDPDNRVLAVT
jgi:aspartate 1-decarboxylase